MKKPYSFTLDVNEFDKFKKWCDKNLIKYSAKINDMIKEFNKGK